MPATLLVVAEIADGHLTKLSAEIATFAAGLAAAGGGSAVGLVLDEVPQTGAQELAAYLPRVVSVASTALARPWTGSVTRPASPGGDSSGWSRTA